MIRKQGGPIIMIWATALFLWASLLFAAEPPAKDPQLVATQRALLTERKEKLQYLYQLIPTWIQQIDAELARQDAEQAKKKEKPNGDEPNQALAQ